MTANYLQLWESLRDSMTFLVNYEPVDRGEADALSVGKSEIEWINAFEVLRKFLLPLSYREYCRVFGPGTLAGFFTITAPMDGRYGVFTDLDEFDRWIPRKDMCSDDFSRSDSDRLDRLLYFCTSVGGDCFGWDPADPQNETHHEYGIYWVPRGSPPQRVATTFQEFIEECCLGSRSEELFGPGEPDPLRFAPRLRSDVLPTQ